MPGTVLELDFSHNSAFLNINLQPLDELKPLIFLKKVLNCSNISF